jgi:RNA polymerase sigma-70 factor (ECF subfamily)
LLNPASPARGKLVQAVVEPSPINMAPPAEDSIPTRHSLLVRLEQWDDAGAWREFFETYWELIYRVARKAGLTEDEAQEVVQETVIGVARRIGEFKTGSQHGSFKSWLLGQARWRIGDQFRKRRRQAERFDESQNAAGRASVPADDATGTATVNRIPDPASLALDETWDAEWEEHLVRNSLERVKAMVSVKQFQMFDLHTRQGLSVKETARATGATMAAVYMAKSRVGRLVRRELERLKTGLH